MKRRAGLAAAAATAAIALVLLRLQGLPIGEALARMTEGAFGSAGAWVTTLRVTAPLALCALGVTIAFRCGLWNIGAEGQLLVGALASAAAASATGHWIPALLAGMAAGFAWAYVPALLSLRRGVPEVLSTLMLNGVAFELLRWLVSGPLQEPSGQFPQTAPIPGAARLPAIEVERAGSLHLGLLIAALLSIVVAAVFARTRAGLRLRAGAQSPRLIEASGWPLARARAIAFAAGGALAGLAGAIEVTGVAGAVDRSMSQGLGYAAIAAALLTGLRPLLVLPAALFFAALANGAASLQWAADLPGIDRFALVVQGLAILAVLATLAVRSRGGGGARRGANRGEAAA